MDKSSQRQRLLEILKARSVELGEFKLSSGRTSTYYIDCKKTTYDPEAFELLGSLFLEKIKPLGVDAVGGPTMGADPILFALAFAAQRDRTPIDIFIVRKSPKEHGQMRLIEGNLKPNATVAILDDVATTGSSILKAVRAAEELGCRVAKTFCLVDRGEGARQTLEGLGYTLEALFEKQELGLQ